MKSAYNRSSLAHLLAMPLDRQLHDLLVLRARQLLGDHDLRDLTHIVVVEPGDTDADLISEIGLTPLENPADGSRFGDAGFVAWWDWLSQHDSGFYEVLICIGDTGYANHLIIHPDADPELLALCREHVA